MIPLNEYSEWYLLMIQLWTRTTNVFMRRDDNWKAQTFKSLSRLTRLVGVGIGGRVAMNKQTRFQEESERCAHYLDPATRKVTFGPHISTYIIKSPHRAFHTDDPPRSRYATHDSSVLFCPACTFVYGAPCSFSVVLKKLYEIRWYPD